MGVNALLVDTDVRAAPGAEAVVPVQVRNTGPVVDQFSVEILGQAAAWTVAEPPELNLFPGEGGEILIRFRPPRSPDVPAGPVPFGVRVASREDPEGSRVEEGVVEVEPFVDLRAELVPQTSRGRWRGRHRLLVDNQGNRPLDVAVLLSDPENQLRLKQSRRGFRAGPGSLTKVRVVAVPRKRFLRGPAVTKPFQALVLPEGPGPDETSGAHGLPAPDAVAPISQEGAFAQRALLPKWLIPALAAAMALAVVLGVLWFTLLKPVVKSAARDAATAQSSAAAASADQAKQQAAAAAQKADQAAAAAAQANPSGAPGAGTGTGTGTGAGANPNDPIPLTQPVDFRIQADAAPRTDGGFNTFTFPGQADRPLDVTDLQLQNPFGDSGVIELRRNGTVWLRFGLDNFRDYDDHYVVPVRFSKGDVLTVAVSCKTPGAGRAHCTPAVSFSGRTTPHS